MKTITSSAIAFAAFTLIVGADTVAAGCAFHKNETTAAATPPPAEEVVAAPATEVDPMLLAKVNKAAILPAVPTEEEVEDTEAD